MSSVAGLVTAGSSCVRGGADKGTEIAVIAWGYGNAPFTDRLP